MKIPLDVDRNIYPSEPPRLSGGPWRANAKGVCAEFYPDRVRIFIKEGPSQWENFRAGDVAVTFGLPDDTAGITVDANVITYSYGDVQIRFEVLLDCIRRTVIVQRPSALAHLADYLQFSTDMPGLSHRHRNGQHIEISRRGKICLHIKTFRAWDNTRIPAVRPCSGGFCSQAKRLGCAGCGDWGGGGCPRTDERRVYYRSAQFNMEELSLQDGILRLCVAESWLNNPARVFPLFINDDITPSAGSLTGAGGWATNTANLVDGDPSTHAGTTCVDPVDPDYANNYVTIDLGTTYRIDWFTVENDAGLCSTALNTGGGDWFQYRLQYRDNGSYVSFSPECVISVPDATTPNTYFQTQRTSNDVSGQGVQTRYLRLAVGGEKVVGAWGNYGQNNLTGEIEIWGTYIPRSPMALFGNGMAIF